MDKHSIITSNQAYTSGNQSNPALQKNAKQLCWEFNHTPPNKTADRIKVLKKLFGTCHDMTFIEPSFYCDYGFNIHTHGMVIINYNCVILDTSPVNIGADVFIGPGICISCAGHAIDPQQRAQGISTSAPITIEDDVWIGANATVGAGVTIGKGTIIGAGSVVTKNIPPGVVAVGNPCRVLRLITEDDRIHKVDL